MESSPPLLLGQFGHKGLQLSHCQSDRTTKPQLGKLKNAGRVSDLRNLLARFLPVRYVRAIRGREGQFQLSFGWPKEFRSRALAQLLCLICFTATVAVAQAKHPEWRALLASTGLDGQPIKGVYFFPGESDAAQAFYTAHPTYYDDTHWDSEPSGRARIVDRMLRAHINTIVLSYWSDMPQWSPMILDGSSVPGVLEATRGKPIVILPTIEGGSDASHPEIPPWEFPTNFPHPARNAGDRARAGQTHSTAAESLC